MNKFFEYNSNIPEGPVSAARNRNKQPDTDVEKQSGREQRATASER